jgi:hypothetical protein
MSIASHIGEMIGLQAYIILVEKLEINYQMKELVVDGTILFK